MSERRIFKYELQVTDVQRIMLPKNAEILAFQCQRDFPRIWAMVDSQAEKVEHTFRIYGTGHPIGLEKSGLQYIGTAQTQNGNLVWHLFEEV